MTDHKVIRGTYADFKIIKTRSVAQFIVEMPIEHAESAIRTFGIPNGQDEQWVAVAALETLPIVRNEDAEKAVQQAGILCGNQEFGNFLIEEMGMADIKPSNPESVAEALRSICNVESRKEFHRDGQALKTFQTLHGEYNKWLMRR